MALSPRQFGHVIFSNIGSLGMAIGFAPLCPPMHAEILLCMGCAQKKPYVDEVTNEIKIGTFVDITATLDHRYGDAAVF